MHAGHVDQDTSSKGVEDTGDEIELDRIVANRSLYTKTYRCANGGGEREDGNQSDHDGFPTNLGVDNVEANGETFEELVHQNGDKERHLVLKTDGKAHKNGVESETEEEDEERGVVHGVGYFARIFDNNLLQLVVAVRVFLNRLFHVNVLVELCLVFALKPLQ